MAATITSDDLARFGAFIEASRSLVPNVTDQAQTNQASLGAFATFLDQAEPLLVKDIRQTLLGHQAELDHLCGWLLPSGYDLLSVAGLTGFEDPYTELIGWMLCPPGHPDVALRCQLALLTSLGLGVKRLDKPAQPHTQFVTATSRPDLAMHFEELGFVLVVEAKTGSIEHETPDEEMQTVAYPKDVRKALRLAADYPVTVVFLTPCGDKAANPDAIPITYLDIVRTLALEFQPAGLPEELRWAYATIFTHFLACAAPEGVDVAEALRCATDTTVGSKKPLDNQTILSNIGGFGAVARLVQRETTP